MLIVDETYLPYANQRQDALRNQIARTLPDSALATGAPQGDGGTRAQNAIAVHFGRDAAKSFLDQPDAYVFPANLSDGDEGTLRLGIVPASDGKPAWLLILLSMAPPLPMRIPFCESRSTKIFAPI